MKRPIAAALCALALLLASFAAVAAGPLGASGLRAHHAALASQLASNAFGGPLVLQSEEGSGRIEGDVYALLDHPFENVSTVLADVGQWCDILILHLNTKYCRRVQEGSATRIDLRVGKKGPQSVDAASLLGFAWRPPQVTPAYLLAQMDAGEGPYDTRNYRLLAEAVPLEGGRTFLHMGYAFSYGGASSFAMKLYLATIGHDKVGFTRVRADGGGQEGYVDGMRGIVERNTMRYYLAIDAYLGSLASPRERQLEQRLQAWFDATEKYPRQLHEVDRDAYLRMKRAEVQRQSAAPVGSARP
jgi:hypothetical protein